MPGVGSFLFEEGERTLLVTEIGHAFRVGGTISRQRASASVFLWLLIIIDIRIVIATVESFLSFGGWGVSAGIFHIQVAIRQ